MLKVLVEQLKTKNLFQKDGEVMMPDQSIDSLNISEQNNCKSHETLKASSKTADKGIGERQKVFRYDLNEQNTIDATTTNGFEFFTRFAYCQALLYKAWVEASDELANKVPKSMNHHANSKETTSLYIDTFEETFTNLFRSPQFVSNLGKLLNSLMEHIKANNDMPRVFLNSLSEIQKNLEPSKNSKNDQKELGD